MYGREMSTISIDLAPPNPMHGPACAQCSGPTRLIGVEPHPTRARTDLRTFQCLHCDAMETAVVPEAN